VPLFRAWCRKFHLPKYSAPCLNTKDFEGVIRQSRGTPASMNEGAEYSAAPPRHSPAIAIQVVTPYKPDAPGLVPGSKLTLKARLS